VASLILQLLLVLGLVLVVLLRVASGKEAMGRAGLRGGKLWHYLVFGLLIILLYGLMTGLNAVFGLGQVVDVKDFLKQASGGQATGMDTWPQYAILLLLGAQTIILGPVIGLLIAFGEEYGWRGYLQSELVKLGKIRGILLLGVIWGLWHAPVIAMGHNYPGYPILGPILMIAYTTGLAFVFGYAVLKSGSVWLAAFLHALNNQVASFFMASVYRPDDPVFSFGVGLYSLPVFAVVIVALLVLDRKTWIAPPTLGSAGGKSMLEEP
jgi:membrane protease YdiL (CAAX protease family)